VACALCCAAHGGGRHRWWLGYLINQRCIVPAYRARICFRLHAILGQQFASLKLPNVGQAFIQRFLQAFIGHRCSSSLNGCGISTRACVGACPMLLSTQPKEKKKKMGLLDAPSLSHTNGHPLRLRGRLPAHLRWLLVVGEAYVVPCKVIQLTLQRIRLRNLLEHWIPPEGCSGSVCLAMSPRAVGVALVGIAAQAIVVVQDLLLLGWGEGADAGEGGELTRHHHPRACRGRGGCGGQETGVNRVGRPAYILCRRKGLEGAKNEKETHEHMPFLPHKQTCQELATATHPRPTCL
jgi:hypothetical protein